MERSQDENQVFKEWKLEKESELRFEVADEVVVKISLTKGRAELFGTELIMSDRDNEVEYAFTSCKKAIFTWQGATLKVMGNCEHIYVANETPMISYVNVHAALDNLRRRSASDAKSLGPKVLVVGPQDSGKTTLCRILLNYAVRAGWAPTYVDVDVGQNSISLPGTVAATPITTTFGIDDDHDYQFLAPLVYYFGHVRPSREGATDMYTRMMQLLAKAVDERAEKDDQSRHAGTIINTCGWVEGEGYDLLVETAKLFQVDVILVIGSERLCSQLKADEKCKATVVKLAKSEGVVSRNPLYRKNLRQKAIKAYFYGSDRKKLCPHPQYYEFKQLRIYRCGGSVEQAPDSALPIGTQRLIDPNRLILCDPNSEDLHKKILAVSYADTEESILDENVAGFVHITNVDVKKRSFTFLMPCASALPQPYLLCGSMKFDD